MRLDRWVKGGVGGAAIVALAACAGQGPTVPAPEADRQVLSVTEAVDIPAMLAQLPERIPVDQADELLVQADPERIAESGASYSVQNHVTRSRFRNRGFYTGFSRGFGSLYRNYSYFPLNNSYVPYYQRGGYYYPYMFADRAYNPFFYGLGNNWIPAYWAR